MNTDIKTRRVNLVRKFAPCPRCGKVGKRHSIRTRRLDEIGVMCPTVLIVRLSVHYCEKCRKHFNVPTDHLAPYRSRCTYRVVWAALDMANKRGVTLEETSRIMREKYFVRVAPTTLHGWIARQLAS